MGPVDLLQHLLNVLAPSLGVAALLALLAPLVLGSGQRWRVFIASALSGAVATAAAIGWLGRDGTMAGYGAIVLAGALAAWASTRGSRP